MSISFGVNVKSKTLATLFKSVLLNVLSCALAKNEIANKKVSIRTCIKKY